MNKKYLLVSLILAFAFCNVFASSFGAAYRNVIPSVPKPNAQVQQDIAKYRQGNYVGAMVDLEDLLLKDKTNILARYYLALCYTQLGFKDQAKKAFNDIAKKNANATLTFYSQRALECLDNPEAEACQGPIVKPPAKQPGDDTPPEELTEMDKFIRSGRMIHPDALDAITKERMDRKLQEDEYRRMQEDKDGVKLDVQSYNQQPTNEEIAAALNVLSRIGMNPFGNNLYNANANYNNLYGNYSRSIDPNVSAMMLFNQYNQQLGTQFNPLTNNMLNYGM